MSLPVPHPPEPGSPVDSPFKSPGGLQRIWRAAGYSWAEVRAAVRHEAAFRQELVVGLPLLVLAWVLAPTRWQALARSASVVLVWVVEMLNSAIEAVSDALSAQHHPLLGRAKDMGSAAVMLALGLCAATWAVVYWPA